MWGGGRGLPDDDALVLLSAYHAVVRVVGDGEDVWGQLADAFVPILVDLFHVVNRQNLVGVDGYQDGTSVGLRIGKKKTSSSKTCSEIEVNFREINTNLEFGLDLF